MRYRIFFNAVIVYAFLIVVAYTLVYAWLQFFSYTNITITMITALSQLLILRYALNKSHSQEQNFKDFGLANWLTLIRGVLLSITIGFAFFSESHYLNLTIAIVYTVSICLDGLDGYIARKIGRVTQMGIILDEEFDAQAVFIGVLLGIFLGNLPIWFLIIGLLRYLRILDIAIRAKLQQDMSSAPSSMYRKRLAGVMMAFISISVYPFVLGTYLQIIAYVFMTPFLSDVFPRLVSPKLLARKLKIL